MFLFQLSCHSRARTVVERRAYGPGGDPFARRRHDRSTARDRSSACLHRQTDSPGLPRPGVGRRGGAHGRRRVRAGPKAGGTGEPARVTDQRLRLLPQSAHGGGAARRGDRAAAGRARRVAGHRGLHPEGTGGARARGGGHPPRGRRRPGGRLRPRPRDAGRRRDLRGDLGGHHHQLLQPRVHPEQAPGARRPELTRDDRGRGRPGRWAPRPTPAAPPLPAARSARAHVVQVVRQPLHVRHERAVDAPDPGPGEGARPIRPGSRPSAVRRLPTRTVSRAMTAIAPADGPSSRTVSNARTRPSPSVECCTNARDGLAFNHAPPAHVPRPRGTHCRTKATQHHGLFPSQQRIGDLSRDFPRQARGHLLLLDRLQRRDREGDQQRRGEGGRRGAPAEGRRTGARGRHRLQRRVGGARRGQRRHPGRLPRRRRVGGRRDLRLADPLRQHLVAAQAVHRHARRPVGAGQARQQGLQRLRHQRHRARRPGVHDPRAVQLHPPLRRHHRLPGLHRPGQVRRRQPLRHLPRRRPGQQPRRRGDPQLRSPPGRARGADRRRAQGRPRRLTRTPRRTPAGPQKDSFPRGPAGVVFFQPCFLRSPRPRPSPRAAPTGRAVAEAAPAPGSGPDSGDILVIV
ncbi:hypothetical protein SGPA1_40722 [Streptomyces misionensis JCM 4497]